ncbi:recombinase [Sediminimonas sp.]|uniref:recombinase n=1 Tax=Sediminimonas sp. TaxID=2823379 RepID=UPI0025DCC65B|nr:recombinase [Sediminimonas sp.]
MPFKSALWNGSDPLYAPCLSWSGRDPHHRQARWKCPSKYLTAGYNVKAVKVGEPGHPGDGHQKERALRCRQLTRELLRWWEGLDHSKVKLGSWHYLIGRYKSDEFSPIHEVKGNTKQGYLQQLAKLEVVVGHMQIEDLTYEQIKRAQKAMEEKGRSVSYIHRFFNTLRRVARYGKALQIREAAAVAETLGEMRFQVGAGRQAAPTREQVYKIVAEADAEGMPDFALGILLQFELTLRAVDVRGQWLATDELEGGIIRNGKRWQDGLTWDMFDPDLSGFSKVISKTAKSLPEPYCFDLAPLPEIQSRLRLLRPDEPVGPVIRSTRAHGLPYTISGWSQAWARLRKVAGLPANIWMMDVRAGAVTEAKSLGVDPYALRDAAQHASVSTTNRYSRSRSEGANQIVQLRRKK